jgi:hypothetical protein
VKLRLSKSLVPGGGVEPPRAEARRILSPLRLPVPPSRPVAREYANTEYSSVAPAFSHLTSPSGRLLFFAFRVKGLSQKANSNEPRYASTPWV